MKEDVYPVGTVVRIRKTGEFALIKQQYYLKAGSFYYYLAEIEGREPGALYCIFHYDIDLECLPPEKPG